MSEQCWSCGVWEKSGLPHKDTCKIPPVRPEDIFIPHVRTFDSGATRDADQDKIDPEGFLCPFVIREFCNYMRTHRKQPDGVLRSSDNWQKGIPQDVYMKSMWRHFLDVWEMHRAPFGSVFDMREALCALLFNVQGYLHEELKKEEL